MIIDNTDKERYTDQVMTQIYLEPDKEKRLKIIQGYKDYFTQMVKYLEQEESDQSIETYLRKFLVALYEKYFGLYDMVSLPEWEKKVLTMFYDDELRYEATYQLEQWVREHRFQILGEIRWGTYEEFRDPVMLLILWRVDKNPSFMAEKLEYWDVDSTGKNETLLKKCLYITGRQYR